jgi:AcrR family transcriptional regulator
MDTPARIVEAALVAFGRYGYRQTSMELVAEQAALSRQALYRHFATKEALFAAAVERLHGEALEAGEAAARAARAAGEDGAGVLAARLGAHFGAILGRLQGSVHAAELLDENHRQCGEIASRAGRRFAARLAASIRAEQRGGRLSLPGSLSPKQLADYLLAAARGVKAAVPPPSPEAFRRDLARMVRLLVDGAARAPRDRRRAPERTRLAASEVPDAGRRGGGAGRARSREGSGPGPR